MSRATIATMTTAPTLRVARPSDNLGALLRFYEQGLGLTLLFRFENHEGFDGIMLGRPGAPYHFELPAPITTPQAAHPHRITSSSTFQMQMNGKWPSSECMTQASSPLRRLILTGIAGGVTFDDPDGYRVVLHQSAWTP